MWRSGGDLGRSDSKDRLVHRPSGPRYTWPRIFLLDKDTSLVVTPGLAASNSFRAFGRALSGAAPVWLTMTSVSLAEPAALVVRTSGETRPARLATSAALLELWRNCRRVRSPAVFSDEVCIFTVGWR